MIYSVLWITRSNATRFLWTTSIKFILSLSIVFNLIIGGWLSIFFKVLLLCCLLFFYINVTISYDANLFKWNILTEVIVWLPVSEFLCFRNILVSFKAIMHLKQTECLLISNLSSYSNEFKRLEKLYTKMK